MAKSNDGRSTRKTLTAQLARLTRKAVNGRGMSEADVVRAKEIMAALRNLPKRNPAKAAARWVKLPAGASRVAVDRATGRLLVDTTGPTKHNPVKRRECPTCGRNNDDGFRGGYCARCWDNSRSNPSGRKRTKKRPAKRAVAKRAVAKRRR